MKAKRICVDAGKLLFLFMLTAMLLFGCAQTPPTMEAGAEKEDPVEQAKTEAADTPSEPAAEPEKEETTMKDTITVEMPAAQSVSTLTFPAADGLTVTADLYSSGSASAPFIILFHQAEYSRGEYLEIAPKLVTLGYNCLAVDQRSGKMFNGVTNETYQAAKAGGLPTAYADAYPDLKGALSYVVSTYAPEKLIVWGSSYSASLALILTAEYPAEVFAVLLFSPGEYFKLNGKKVAEYAANITQPVFITSARSEEMDWRPIADQIKSEGSVFFVPEGNGRHGSSALFESAPDHAEYWTAVEAFLSSLK
jgi:dienelactone hydrolase